MMQTQNEKKIYLVRHGRPQLPDEQKYYLGQTDLPLSAQGQKQALWLQQFFQNQIAQQEISCIYHSPLQRCHDTARIIASDQVPCVAVCDLQEIALGEWEMQLMGQIQQRQPEAYQQRGEQIDSFCPPGGESFLQCQKRSVAAFQQIAAQTGKTSIVVAHAGVNRCILSWIRQQPLRQLLSIAQPYACITELVQTEQKWIAGQQRYCPL